MSISRCHRITHFRELARKRLPSPMFHFIDGGSDDEYTLQRNTTAFDDYQLMPNYLVDVAKIDTRTKLFGKTLDWPVFLSPTGTTRLFHTGKELAVARAAKKMNTLYSVSTMSTTSLEDIAAVSDGLKMFQIYVFKDRELTREFVQRCKASKYDVLCLTVDVPVPSNRERDRMTGMTIPPRFGLNSLLSFAMHPGWSLPWLTNPRFALENVAHRAGGLGPGINVMDYVNSQFDRTVTWKDAEWLAKEWGGPFVIKGLMSPDDAKRAKDIGATAVMVSNHGGRQMDAVPGAVECVGRMRDAVGDGLELIVDGGIRRGTHVIKALALGANACSIGRPYLWGLASGGEAGVERVISLLRAEVERDMALLGVSTIGEIGAGLLVNTPKWPSNRP